jgi:hypothetical protein
MLDDTILENFQWYDFVVIFMMSHLLSVLLIVTLMGGGFITGIMLALGWEVWRFYERARAKMVDT